MGSKNAAAVNAGNSPTMPARRRAVVGELLAMAPRQRAQLFIPRPQRRRERSEACVGCRRLELPWISGDLVERLLQKRRAEEIADAWVCRAAWMSLSPRQQLL